MINGTDQILDSSPGKLIEVVKQAATNTGLKLNFIRVPWARCLNLVTKGKTDGLLPLVKTAERAKAYQYPTSEELYVGRTAYHVFYPVKSQHKGFFEQLALAKDKSQLSVPELNYGLGAPFAYKITGDLSSLGLLSNHYYKPDTGLVMVANNKLDGYIMMKNIGEQKVQDLAIAKQIQVSHNAFAKEKIYVAFNKEFYQQNRQVIDVFWQALEPARKQILNY